MIDRIRDGLWYLKLSIGTRLHRPSRVRSRYSAPVKGNMRSVIVVKPDNAMFSEAVFILSDEYLRQQTVSSDEILRQAREAVASYARRQPELYGKSRAGHLWLWLLAFIFLTVLGFACWRFVPGMALF